MENKTLIICPKLKGNTYKVANYLNEHSEADLLVLEENQSVSMEQYTQIVVCSGVYGDKNDKTLVEWLKNLAKDKLHSDVKFYAFYTWFGRGKSDQHAMNELVSIWKEKGLSYSEQYGKCLGGKWFIRLGHPNKKEFEDALVWLNKLD